MIVNIKLATQPGISNINGITYTKQEYDNMINSPYYQFLKENNWLYVTFGTEDVFFNIRNIHTFLSNHPDLIIGRVIEKYNTSVDIDITNECLINLINLGQININNYILGMAYLGSIYKVQGKFYVKDMNFGYYYLMNDKMSIKSYDL
jgi:hypothetical protein